MVAETEYERLYKEDFPRGKPLGRKPVGTARIISTGVGLTAQEIAAVDKAKGMVTRSAYLRDMIITALKEKGLL